MERLSGVPRWKISHGARQGFASLEALMEYLRAQIRGMKRQSSQTKIRKTRPSLLNCLVLYAKVLQYFNDPQHSDIEMKARSTLSAGMSNKGESFFLFIVFIWTIP
jgi:hypothetical protein